MGEECQDGGLREGGGHRDRKCPRRRPRRHLHDGCHQGHLRPSLQAHHGPMSVTLADGSSLAPHYVFTTAVLQKRNNSRDDLSVHFVTAP